MRITRPDDFHVHVRQSPGLASYVEDCASVFRHALIMPNTLPPISSPSRLKDYRAEIMAAASPFPWFSPLMTFKILPETRPESLVDLKDAGAIAGKLYPQGATTNSSDGVAELEALYPVFAAMEQTGLMLCIHGEEPAAFSLERESAYLPNVSAILKAFPSLKVVLEHVSTAAGIDFVTSGPPTLGATITVHHLLHNLDDMLGGHLNPHLFCKPILRTPADQAALRAAVLGNNPRVFFGSDSAPHPKTAKECDCGAAGVYSMPVAIPLLTEFFSLHGSRQRLEAFTSTNGCAFYGLSPSNESIELVEESWTVPREFHGVVPLAAGRALGWRIRS